MGVFTQMTDGLSSLNFNISPTAILIPPVQDQSFLSGLIGGSGISSVNGTGFAALYFQSSSYSPGQVISNSTLPTGVSQTELGEPVIGCRCCNTAGSIVPTTVATGPDRRPDRGQLRLQLADLLDLHGLRHAGRRRDSGDAGLQRHPGLKRRALDRQRQRRIAPATGGTASIDNLGLGPPRRRSAGSRASRSTSTATSRRASGSLRRSAAPSPVDRPSRPTRWRSANRISAARSL